MAKYDLSIIIPIYNLAPYISRTLESILSQGEGLSYQIIVVDDGSDDSSGEICDSYTLRHPNIVTLHQSNRGVSAARNSALDVALGRWVTFVDGDDELCEGGLRRAIRAMNTEPEVEIHIFQSIRYTQGHKRYAYPFSEELHGKLTTGEELFSRYKYRRGSVCGVVFDLEFLRRHNILFVEQLANSEDLLLFNTSLYYSRRVRLSNIDLYQIDDREGSASRDWNKQRVIKYSHTLLAIERELHHRDIDYFSTPIFAELIYIIISTLLKRSALIHDEGLFREVRLAIVLSTLYPIPIFGRSPSSLKIVLLNCSVRIFYFVLKLRYATLCPRP